MKRLLGIWKTGPAFERPWPEHADFLRRPTQADPPVTFARAPEVSEPSNLEIAAVLVVGCAVVTWLLWMVMP